MRLTNAGLAHAWKVRHIVIQDSIGQFSSGNNSHSFHFGKHISSLTVPSIRKFAVMSRFGRGRPFDGGSGGMRRGGG